MSTLEGYHEYIGGYHDKCGGRSLEKQLNLYETPAVLNIPQCTHDHRPTLIMVSPGLLMISPSVLNILQCTEHPQCTAQALCRVISFVQWANR